MNELNGVIIAELKELFRDGCTIAGLLRHVERQLGPASTPGEAAKYVWTAFGIGPSGWYFLPSTASFGDGSVPDWKLTSFFLRSVLERTHKWDSRSDVDRAAWFDGLKQRASDELRQQVVQYRAGLSDEGWSRLDENDRDKVVLNEVLRLRREEEIDALAALAECLQVQFETGVSVNDLGLTAAQVADLQSRIAQFEKDPEVGRPWEEVKAELMTEQ